MNTKDCFPELVLIDGVVVFFSPYSMPMFMEESDGIYEQLIAEREGFTDSFESFQ